MLIYLKPNRCIVCGTNLSRAFNNVEDKVYGVPGKWNIDRCDDPNCAVLHLAHDLTVKQISSFYETYSTHSPPVVATRGVKKLYRDALKHIQHLHLGYPVEQHGSAKIVAQVLDRVPYFREMAKSRVYWLPYVADGVVVEVGFGNGQSLALLRELGWRVHGCELDETCVDFAQHMGFDAVLGEFTDGLFGAGSVDAVVASHAIEHVPDPRAFFNEALRILLPGGRMILRTPNAASDDAKRTGSAWRGLEVPRHLSIHTPGSLASLARQTGFEDIRVCGTPLGGFITQQSKQLHAHETPSRRQSLKTVPFDMSETLRAIRENQTCAEIYLSCAKPH